VSHLPIACTLTAPDLAAVKERYRVAASHYRATARFNHDHADIELVGNTSALGELLTEMIARESACCSFLAFDCVESDVGYNVRLRVIDASGLANDILRESVATFFPTAVVLP
jgi:hypothetical protein